MAYNVKIHYERNGKKMKKSLCIKRILVCLILSGAIVCSVSCSRPQDEQATAEPEASIQKDVYEEKIAYCLRQIADLEDQLAEKKQQIYTSENQYQLEIAALKATIASLKAQIDNIPGVQIQKPSDIGNQGQNNQGQNNQSQNNQTGTEEQDKQFTYVKENGGITITKYTGKDTEVKIPEAIDGQRVLCIGESAFASSDVKSVIIPEGVQKIDWFAFQACTQLVEITIPSSVTKIEYGAFDYAKPSFVIKCAKGSFVEAYAKSWGYICITQ